MSLTLNVQILKGGEVVRTVTLADPRKAYCEAIRKLGVGLTARPQPTSRAMRLASSRRGSE